MGVPWIYPCTDGWMSVYRRQILTSKVDPPALEVSLATCQTRTGATELSKFLKRKKSKRKTALYTDYYHMNWEIPREW